MDLTAQTEQTIHSHRLPGLDKHLPQEFILPYYDGYSITNLAATIAGLLGVELEGTAPPIPSHLWADMAPGVRNVIIVILDAVGYKHLERALSNDTRNSFLRHATQAGRFFPLTSVFPSTTVAALTTIWTGQAPINHGFLGTKLLLPEYGLLADMLSLGPAIHRRPGELLNWGWKPEEFVTIPSLGQQLTANGVQTIANTHSSFLKGGLTHIFLRGMASVRGHVSFSDMWINLRHLLLQRTRDLSPANPLFISAYWGDIDATAHAYGPEGERFQSALRLVLRSLEEDFLTPLPAAAREGTVLIITADHGQTTTPPERIVRFSDQPAFQRMLLLPPAAESRAAYLYVRPGQTQALRTYVAERMAGRFLLLETEQAIEAGLFGPVPSQELAPEIRTRLGDMLLLAQDDSRLLVTETPTPFHGHHGSLTPEEMLVPLLMMRLDTLRE